MLSSPKYLAIAGVLAATLTLAACVPAGDTASSSSDQEFNDQDVTFAQMMVPHHEQAIEMADMILEKDAIDPQVTELAQVIKEEQQPELDQLNGWLEEWDASDDMGGMDHSGGMSGEMSDEDMSNLESATGDPAARLFLEGMTVHHEGAIEMAQTEVDEGKYPDAITLAQNIIDAQQSEIEQMQEILATL